MVSNHKKKKKGAGYGAKRHGQNPHRRNQGAFHSFRDFDDDDDDDDDDIFGFSIKGAAAKDASRRPWSRKGGKDTQKSSFALRGTKPNKKHDRLTMAEEAQFTGRHDHHAIKSSAALRAQPIKFVSSGLLNDKRDSEQKAQEISTKPTSRSMEKTQTPAAADNHRNIANDDNAKQQDVQMKSLQDGIGRVAIRDSARCKTSSSTTTKTSSANQDAPGRRSPSPTPSDSSMEEVVFVGRDVSPGAAPITEKTPPASNPSLPPLFTFTSATNNGNGHAPVAHSEKQASANVVETKDSSPVLEKRAAIRKDPTVKNEPEPAVPPEWAFKEQPSGPDAKRNKGNKSKRYRKAEVDDNTSELDDILADYIDNMAGGGLSDDDDDDLSRMLKASRATKPAAATENTGQDVKATKDTKEQLAAKPKAARNKAHKRVIQQAIDDDTDNEMPAEIGEILEVRERVNGSVQFLVSDIDLPVDEGARWVTQKLLESHERGDSLVQDFWAAKIMESSSSSNTDVESGPEDESVSESEGEEDVDDDVIDSDGGGNNDNGIRDDSNSDEDDDDDDEMDNELENFIYNDIDSSAMTDEAIARALGMQEQMGLDTDEVMLFDGNEDFIPLDPRANKQKKKGKKKQREMELDIERQLNEFLPASSAFPDDDDDDIPMIKQTKSKKKGKPQKAEGTEFPSASAFADTLDQDPYGAYDIMDFERPSLRRGNKGRKAPDFQLSDEELTAQLQQSWETDRNKKKKRKQDREERRREGLLGVTSKTGRTTLDLQLKYSRGMKMDDVGKEVRQFLLSSSDSIALPPMMKRERKLVHRLSNLLSLTSKSRGNGMSRFTVLAKNKRTAKAVSVGDLDSINDKIDSFVRGGSSITTTTTTTTTRSGGGKGLMMGGARRGGDKASYREGEVVGASAPAIPSGNVGRMMLEKMGWMSGMALGTNGNQGILEPVSHVVKKSKAGLG